MKFSKITISGKICTGKTTLRNLLAKKLGWQTFSTGELFRKYTIEYHLNLNNAEEQNNKLSKKIDNQVSQLLKTKDHFIVDSWLAGVTAANIPKVLKILLICKDDIRYKRFAKREKISFEEAKQKVEERFFSWARKIKKIYQRDDFFDPKHFDLIIDTSHITPYVILKKVLMALR